MTPEEIKAKASELAALYTAKANGKILEYDTKAIGWVDNGSSTQHADEADRWKARGNIVTEWQEVLP